MQVEEKLLRINMGSFFSFQKFILEGMSHRVFFPTLSRDHSIYM